MNLQTKKLNNTGVAHHAALAILVVAIVAGIGAYRIFFSSAATARICYGVYPVSDKPLRWGFRDPSGIIKNVDLQVKDLTADQVTSLRYKDGNIPIYRLTYLVSIAAKYGVNLSLEIKDPARTQPRMSQIVRAVNKYGVRSYIKGNTKLAGMDSALAEARGWRMWTRGLEDQNGNLIQGWRKPQPVNCQLGPTATNNW